MSVSWDDLEDWPDEPVATPDFGAPSAMPMGGAYKERCNKCGGTGRFTGYTGRSLGECFSCKGKGFREYRTSGQDRAKAAVSRARTAVRKADSIAEQAAEWRTANPDLAAWIVSRAPRFDFAAAMNEAISKYGHLTDAQLATVTRLCERDKVRDAERATAKAALTERATAMDIGPISAAFAKASGEFAPAANVVLRFDGFRISRDKRDHAKLWVNAEEAVINRFGEMRRPSLGRIEGGRFVPGRDCTPELQAAIMAAAADPVAAAIAYGRRTGNCCCCGKLLTDPVSVERGIGPICESRWF
jgi:hypothetical protein